MVGNTDDCYASEEWEFLDKMEGRERYRGQWIAILGSRVIASGVDLKDVYAMAKSVSDSTPFIVKMPDTDADHCMIV